MTWTIEDSLLQHELNGLRVMDQWRAYADRLGYVPRSVSAGNGELAGMYNRAFFASFPDYLQTGKRNLLLMHVRSGAF